jgi:hypothetical protein
MDNLPEIRKAYPALALISVLLLSVMVGVRFVFLAEANPYMYLGNVPPDSNTKPPEISILYPENNTIFANNSFTLNFTINVGPSTTGSFLNIYDASYKADWKPYDQWVNPELTEFSFNLTNILDGNHSITVDAAEEGSYVPAQNNSNPMTRNDFYINGSSSVFFIVDTTSPSVSLLSMDNKTYNTHDIPLDFTVNEPITQITYSLDGQDNVTISENSTIIGLSSGKHNVTVYATDLAGHVGSSETVTFTVVNQPEPFPTAPVAAASVATVAIAGVGLLVYFRKKRPTQKMP